jgi:hypothetical protein
MDTTGKLTYKTAGQQVSNSSGNFTTTNSSATDVTNLSVTITTRGRPVLLFLISGTTTANGNFGYSGGSGSSVIVSAVLFVRDGTTIARLSASFSIAGGGTATNMGVPLSAVMHLDTPAAGTYTYKIQILQTVGGGSAAINEGRLVAIEL